MTPQNDLITYPNASSLSASILDTSSLYEYGGHDRPRPSHSHSHCRRKTALLGPPCTSSKSMPVRLCSLSPGTLDHPLLPPLDDEHRNESSNASDNPSQQPHTYKGERLLWDDCVDHLYWSPRGIPYWNEGQAMQMQETKHLRVLRTLKCDARMDLDWIGRSSCKRSTSLI